MANEESQTLIELKRGYEEAIRLEEEKKRLEEESKKSQSIVQSQEAPVSQINFALDVYKFLISFLSKTVILGLFLILLFAKYPEMSFETKGFIMGIYSIMTGTSLIRGQNEKKLEAQKEIAKINITPLSNDTINGIVNEVKKVIPQGLG